MSNKSFENDFIRGYRDYTQHFQKWCRDAYVLFGNIIQCGFIDVNSSGMLKIAANREDIAENCLINYGWKYHLCFSYFMGFQGDDFVVGSDRDIKDYTSKFQHFWFLYRVMIDSDTQRINFFVADTPQIHSALVNNIGLVKKFLKIFNDENEKISQRCQEHMVDMASMKSDYFVEISDYIATDRLKFNKLFQSMGMLNEGNLISAKEWGCLKLYSQGKSARETGEILHISRRTVENHFNSVKEKLKVDSKSKILEIIL